MVWGFRTWRVDPSRSVATTLAASLPTTEVSAPTTPSPASATSELPIAEITVPDAVDASDASHKALMTPAVRRLLKENQLPVHAIKGSGKVCGVR